MSSEARAVPAGRQVITGVEGLTELIAALQRRGYRVLGPTVCDRAIVYDEIASAADLPSGWTDEQDGGAYRLERRSDDALFGYAVGPHSWKQFLHPPSLRLWRATRTEDGFRVESDADASPRLAFLGVRSCELHAIRIQDRVLLDGPHADPHYRSRREDSFIAALNCGEAGGTCFCVSMQTGPEVSGPCDLVLTELLDEQRHEFLVQTGSARGGEVLREVSYREATAEDTAASREVTARTARRMGRHMDTRDIQGLLQRNPEHPRWDEVAGRCLTCGNCTLVCPTCFCTTVEDATDLSGSSAERMRRWDSCFTLEFSYVHGGSVRQSNRARYRQWMTHKLSTWYDQFGTTGCVGCGRCITWCPVGIDITEEAAAIRATQADAGEEPHGDD